MSLIRSDGCHIWCSAFLCLDKPSNKSTVKGSFMVNSSTHKAGWTFLSGPTHEIKPLDNRSIIDAYFAAVGHLVYLSLGAWELFTSLSHFLWRRTEDVGHNQCDAPKRPILVRVGSQVTVTCGQLLRWCRGSEEQCSSIQRHCPWMSLCCPTRPPGSWGLGCWLGGVSTTWRTPCFIHVLCGS